METWVARVADRVKQGGHNIPSSVIKRRFNSGLKNLFSIYHPLLDRWILLDASETPNPIAIEVKGMLDIINQVRYNEILRKNLK